MPKDFRVVTIGDSAAWGQGLELPQKYTTLVANSISASTGRRVVAEILAHSGAVIAPDAAMDARFSAPATAVGPEVPCSWPSITAQASMIANPETVDLVLLDGGINDLDAGKIVDPTIDHPHEWFDTQAREFCGQRMESLLRAVGTRCSHAVIVVVGYFPLVSAETPSQLLPEIFAHFNLIVHALQGTVDDQKARLTANSEAWVDRSNFWLNHAIASIGGGLGPGRAITLAPVPWAASECYGAPQTALWRVDQHDPMMGRRKDQCLAAQSAGSIGILEVPKCERANSFHPNARGALKMANAIVAAVQSVVPVWTLQGADAPEPVPTMTATVNPFAPPFGISQHFTVTVTDTRTGQAVDAALLLGNQSLGTSASGFTMTCTASPQVVRSSTDRSPHVPGQSSVALQREWLTDYPVITVRHAGYQDCTLFLGPIYEHVQPHGTSPLANQRLRELDHGGWVDLSELRGSVTRHLGGVAQPSGVSGGRVNQ